VYHFRKSWRDGCGRVESKSLGLKAFLEGTAKIIDKILIFGEIAEPRRKAARTRVSLGPIGQAEGALELGRPVPELHLPVVIDEVQHIQHGDVLLLGVPVFVEDPLSKVACRRQEWILGHERLGLGIFGVRKEHVHVEELHQPFRELSISADWQDWISDATPEQRVDTCNSD